MKIILGWGLTHLNLLEILVLVMEREAEFYNTVGFFIGFIKVHENKFLLFFYFLGNTRKMVLVKVRIF